MKINLFKILSLLLLISCNDLMKNKQLENQNLDKRLIDINSKKDTINFVHNYIFNLSKKSNTYLKNEILVSNFNDSLDVEKVSFIIDSNNKKNLFDEEIIFDKKIYIDFENFTLSFISNEDSEMFCMFKKFEISQDLILINIYLNDNLQTCIINKKTKTYQLFKGEVTIFDNNLILINNNDVNYYSIKFYKIENNAIICWKNFYSLENAFHSFQKENNTISFYSTKKDKTMKYILELK